MERIQQFFLALRLQHGFEFRVGVEMIFDRSFGAARDEYQRFGAGGQCFVDRVLDERFIDDRQHLLRACLGDGQKSGAAAGNGKYGCLDGFVGHA